MVATDNARQINKTRKITFQIPFLCNKHPLYFYIINNIVAQNHLSRKNMMINNLS